MDTPVHCNSVVCCNISNCVYEHNHEMQLPESYSHSLSWQWIGIALNCVACGLVLEIQNHRLMCTGCVPVSLQNLYIAHLNFMFYHGDQSQNREKQL